MANLVALWCTRKDCQCDSMLLQWFWLPGDLWWIPDGTISSQNWGETGCLLSPSLFLVVLDWVTREAYGAGRTGIQWSLTCKLEDLNFADDLCLMSQKLQHMQEKVEALQDAAERVGLKINKEKTQEMRIQTRDDSPIHIGDEVIQRTDHFTYLGSVVSESRGTEEDNVARIRKAQQAIATLRSVWKSRTISLKTKLRIFNCNIKSVLLYGSEIWQKLCFPRCNPLLIRGSGKYSVYSGQMSSRMKSCGHVRGKRM